MDSLENRQLASDHLGRLLDLYKHHYDLFVKGYVFYMGIVGALTTLLFRFVDRDDEKILLFGIGTVVSGLSVVACYFAYRWSHEIEAQAASLAEGLGLRPVPLGKARQLVVVLLVLSSVMLVALGGKLVFFERRIPAATTSEASSKATSESTSEAGFVNKVWSVRESSAVALGTLYVFLSEGTLVIASDHGEPALGAWRYVDGALTMVEEGIEYPTDILALSADQLDIRSHNPGEPVEITLVTASNPRHAE